jgi:hypothetical protein
MTVSNCGIYSQCAQLLLAVDLFANVYNYGFSSVFTLVVMR